MAASSSSSSWFSMSRVLNTFWKRDSIDNDCKENNFYTTNNNSNIDIEDILESDDGSDDDDDDDDDDHHCSSIDDDDDEWQDRELTPTKYRQMKNIQQNKEEQINYADEIMNETKSNDSLTISLHNEDLPELRKAEILFGSAPVIWRPKVNVFQVYTTPIIRQSNGSKNTGATTFHCHAASTPVCNSPDMTSDSTSLDFTFSTSSISSTGPNQEQFNNNIETNWGCCQSIYNQNNNNNQPPPLPPPDWPEAEQSNENRLAIDIRKKFVPEVRKIFFGSVHQLAHGTTAGRIKSKWKKIKKTSLPTTTSTTNNWNLQGQSGFEDLRRYIKQGGDFCKELATILQERSEAESQYSKTLAKLSSKLVKATKEGTGSVNSAWHRIAVEMDAQADIHRHFASSLSEEVVKPLKQLLDSQHRIRKSVETAVDKSGKNLAEWRAAESKAKKNSFTCARENEKLREPNNENRNSRLSASSLHIHKQNGDKETKLESKRRKAEECVKKADVEYYTVCLRAERSRLEWESAIVRGSHCFQVLEEERLRGLRDLAKSYVNNHNLGPKFSQISSRLAEPLDCCDIDKDLEIVSTLRTATEPSQEQMLPDFYPEHTALAMNRDRRKQALINLLQLIRADLERERRGKVGVENLARALKQTPTFASEDSQQNVHDKLHHMRSMLTYLEAARYKVQNALAELEGGPPASHPLAGHIHMTRDRQGYQQSVLKVPPWVHNETQDISSEYSDWVDRGTADGTSVQPDSDFDEFSSQGSEKDFDTSVIKIPEASPQRCKALYNYTANLYDELTLNPGDIINIHDKQPDGWWLGELNGVVGIFPATYVEEIK